MTTAIEISQPPSRAQKATDRIFRNLCQTSAWLAVLIAIVIVLTIVVAAVPAVRQYGLGFLTGKVWDPNKKQYSILPEIWGTLYSSVLALIVGTAFGVTAAVFLAEGFVADYVFAALKVFNLQFPRSGANCRC